MKNRIFLILLAVMLALSIGLVGCGGEEVPEIAEYNLTISSTEGGSVATPGQGTESFTYEEGEVVDLVAVAEEDYYFVNWTGNVGTIADVNDATTTITMSGDYSITADFQLSVPTSILEGPQGYPEDPSLTPEYGGTLKILNDYAPRNLGAPWATGGRDMPMARFTVEKLLGLNEDGELAPQLATDWDEDADAKTITFYLREGVKFHDGTDFNAAAAKWNMDMYREGSNTELDNCSAVDVIDTYTVKLTFSAWDPLLIRSFHNSPAGIMVSPTWAQSHTDAEAMLHPVGTGPFEFVSYAPDITLTYERFDDYWQEGLPYLDGVQINFVADESVRLAAFTNGEADVMTVISASNAVNLKEQGYEVVGRVVHIKGIAGDIKNTDSPFYDIRVRQAMVYAIPTESIVNSVFDGQYTYTNQLALPELTGWDSTIEGYPYDPAKARELMEAAGYSGSNRLSVKLTHTGEAGMFDFYVAVQDYLAAVYIDINPVANPGYRGYVTSNWEKGSLVEYQFSYSDLDLPYEQSLTMRLSENQTFNKLIVTPPEFNTLYDSMMAEMNLAARDDMYKQLNKTAIDGYCLVLPQFGFEVFSARQPNVHDFGWGVCASEYLPEMAWLGE